MIFIQLIDSTSMKKLFICLFMLLSFMSIMAQQVSHTVQRGETLESIAKKYNVSVYALTQSNPDAKEMFYVGMKLVIPSAKATKNEIKTPETVSPVVESPTVQSETPKEAEARREAIVKQEEESFHRTLANGEALLNELRRAGVL